MKVIVELKLGGDTQLDGVKQVQLRCAVGKIIDSLAAQGIRCTSYDIKVIQELDPEPSPP